MTLRYMILLLLVTVLATLGVAQRASVVHLGYHIERLEAERERLAERNRCIHCEISALSEPARIAALAGRLDDSLLDPDTLDQVSRNEEPGRNSLTGLRQRR